MHELSLAEALVELAKEHAKGQVVKSLTVRIGVNGCIRPEVIASCYELLKERDSLLKDSELSILISYPKAKCQSCGVSFDVMQDEQACGCGSRDYTLNGGDELVLQDLVLQN